MIQNLKLWSGCLVFVFLLASCASTAHVEKDDNTDFSKYKTFAWAERQEKDQTDKKDSTKNNSTKNSDLAEQNIRDAVNKELEKTAGWKESKTNPDILLSYDLLVERSRKQESDAVYSNPFGRTFYSPYSRRYYSVYYPSRFIGYDYYDVNIREGTVTISMIDANTDKTVWQGWATDEVDSRNMTSQEIQSSIRAIFRKFDIAKS